MRLARRTAWGLGAKIWRGLATGNRPPAAVVPQTLDTSGWRSHGSGHPMGRPAIANWRPGPARRTAAPGPTAPGPGGAGGACAARPRPVPPPRSATRPPVVFGEARGPAPASGGPVPARDQSALRRGLPALPVDAGSSRRPAGRARDFAGRPGACGSLRRAQQPGPTPPSPRVPAPASPAPPQLVCAWCPRS